MTIFNLQCKMPLAHTGFRNTVARSCPPPAISTAWTSFLLRRVLDLSFENSSSTKTIYWLRDSILDNVLIRQFINMRQRLVTDRRLTRTLPKNALEKYVLSAWAAPPDY